MADYTENYNLKKPDRTDFYSVQDFNDNADIIDAALDDKLNKDFSNVSSGAVPIANGGTGATTAADALNNLGVTTALSNKVDKDLSNVTGTLPITKGGTGATTAAQALINLGVENNYKLLGNNGLLSNQDVLSYITSLEEPQCGFFRTEDCTGTPDDTNRWWSFNLVINKGNRKVLFAYCVSDYTNAICDIWVNQRCYVNNTDVWCGWCKVAPGNYDYLGLVSNRDLLSWADSLKTSYSKCGYFYAEMCSNTPRSDCNYYWGSISVNQNQIVIDVCCELGTLGTDACSEFWTIKKCYNQNTGSYVWRPWAKIGASGAFKAGVSYVSSTAPTYASNNDLWAW